MTQQKLGFGNTLRPKRIFIEKDSSSLWHFWNSESQQKEPILHAALTGYLTNIKKAEVTSTFGDSVKLLVIIQADITYEIQVGYSTWFAKTLLLNLNALSSKALKESMTLEPFSNTTGKVVLCNLFDSTGARVVANYEWQKDSKGKVIDNLDIDLLFKQVVDRLGIPLLSEDNLADLTEETNENSINGFSGSSLDAVVF
ncbi:MAG: hypothetical protein ACRC80_11230 [Waterburya sp.]